MQVQRVIYRSRYRKNAERVFDWIAQTGCELLTAPSAKWNCDLGGIAPDGPVPGEGRFIFVIEDSQEMEFVVAMLTVATTMDLLDRIH
jgi:hypothetical protein